MTTNENVHKLSDKKEDTLRSVRDALEEALEVSNMEMYSRLLELTIKEIKDNHDD